MVHHTLDYRGHSIYKGGHIFPHPNSPSLSVHAHKQCGSLLKTSLIAVFCSEVSYKRHVRKKNGFLNMS